MTVACGDFPVLLRDRSHRTTRYALTRFAQTGAVSQSTKRACSAPTLTLALLGVPEAPPGRCARSRRFAETVLARHPSSATLPGIAAGGVRRGDFCGGEKRRGECWRAQRETCTCSSRLFERNGAKRNAASSATQPTPEHRSGVFAKRKPPQHEPRRTSPAAMPARATAVSRSPPATGRLSSDAQGLGDDCRIYSGQQCSSAGDDRVWRLSPASTPVRRPRTSARHAPACEARGRRRPPAPQGPPAPRRPSRARPPSLPCASSARGRRWC